MSVRAIQDAKFNAWVYEILSNLTPAQKEMLNNVELKQIATNGSRKRFAAAASYEKLNIILSKIGIRCCQIYFYSGRLRPELIRGSYSQYMEKGKAADFVNEIAEKRIFVNDDRQIAISLSLMSMMCHSLAFEPNTEFKKAKGLVGDLRKAMKEKSIESQLRDNTQGFQAVAKILFHSRTIDGWIAGKFNIQVLDLMILLLLVQNPNQYVRVTRLYRLLAHKNTKDSVGKRCNFMYKQSDYIERMHSSERQPAYRISTKGILLVGEVLNHIVNHLD